MGLDHIGVAVDESRAGRDTLLADSNLFPFRPGPIELRLLGYLSLSISDNNSVIMLVEFDLFITVINLLEYKKESIIIITNVINYLVVIATFHFFQTLLHNDNERQYLRSQIHTVQVHRKLTRTPSLIDNH